MFRVNSIDPVPIEAQDIDKVGQATLARVKDMQLNAVRNFGYWNPRYGGTQTQLSNHDKLFPIGSIGNGKDAPKLKMKDVMSETNERRIRRASESVV